MEKRISTSALSYLFVFLLVFEIFYPSLSFALSVDMPNWHSSIKNDQNFYNYNPNQQNGVKSNHFLGLDEVRKVLGGPDQPESSAFTPIDVSNLVDPFTGDFSYNIPLMDVEGYPINLAYDANVMMSSESSWVGLGWNVNPGAVNRNVRGIPDDFNGTEKMEKILNMKDEFSITLGADFNYELFGFNPGDVYSASITLSPSITYNNYSGFTSSFSISPAFDIASKAGLGLNVGFSLGGSSSGGASFNPNVGLSAGNKKGKLGINVGSAYSSRQGLQTISYSGSVQRKLNQTQSKVTRSLPTKASAGSSYSFMQQTYTPTIRGRKSTYGLAGKLNVTGVDLLGFDAGFAISAGFTFSRNLDTYTSTPAYGYNYLNLGQNNSNGILDFNKQNDGGFSKTTPATTIPNVTYDMYSVSAQGIGGSYVPFRSEFGYTFDAASSNESTSDDAGLEFQAGGVLKGGIDLGRVTTSGNSNVWRENNHALISLGYKSSNFTFREANESSIVEESSDFINKFGGDKPSYFELSPSKGNPSLLNSVRHEGTGKSTAPMSSRKGFNKRNQFMQVLTIGELFAGGGLERMHPNQFYNNNGHHIGQICVNAVDGKKFYYGIAAYNLSQETSTFAVNGNDVNYGKNTVSYNSTDNSISNTKGIDRFYSKESIPPHAHSYLLTAVVSDDFMDRDTVRGPSKGDLGTYHSFKYAKVTQSSGYKWRTPIQKNEASFNPGIFGTNTDDKGTVMYGTKELWYLTKIVSRNKIAVFYTSDRVDGLSVEGPNGGLSTSGAKQQVLDSIKLFNLKDYESKGELSTPLQIVEFSYSYDLCKGYDNNLNGLGKLTLLDVSISYQKSKKGKINKYSFKYNANNPNYNLNHVDRWGNYMSNNAIPSSDISQNKMTNKEFPYLGSDKSAADIDASAWKLTEITLPSKGKIVVEYESDDYTHVQHKRAMHMFKIVGTNTPFSDQLNGTQSTIDLSGNPSIMIELGSETDFSNNLEDYVQGIAQNMSEYQNQGKTPLYFRVLADIDGSKNDYVPGYCFINKGGSSISTINGKRYLKLALQPVNLNDSDDPSFSPIIKATIGFSRINLSNFIPPSNQGNEGPAGIGLDVMKSMVGAFSSMGELVTGPNKALYNKGIGHRIYANKSYVRLFSSRANKLGGGHRVKTIKFYDNWSNMSNQSDLTRNYGQEYSYTKENGVSSGNASYEPQLGSDENPWKNPMFYDIKYVLAPDEQNYQELPFGEDFFPSASVGYSKVTISNVHRENVKKHATGKTVKEFYTSQDFPTIAKFSSPSTSNNSLYINQDNLFLFLYKKNFSELAVSQGFVIENNDMHGKPKGEYQFEEDAIAPLNKVEYFYNFENLSINIPAWDRFNGNINFPLPKKLVNTVRSIDKTGKQMTSVVGVEYDQFSEFKESKTDMLSISLNGNANTILFVPIPVLLGKVEQQKTLFRSASLVKTIKRFGILKETVATELAGSIVKTQNLVYDSETGAVLLTQVNTDFNDTIFNLSMPAHWYYTNMGQAYLSGQHRFRVAGNVVNGAFNGIGINNGLVIGDELFLIQGSSAGTKTWIENLGSSSVRLIGKDGSPINKTGLTSIIVTKSGRNNQAGTSIQTIVSRTNPLIGLTSNNFQNILQTSAVEYSDDWKIYCECDRSFLVGSNPFVLGKKGRWKPKASYSYLTNRTQTFENSNSNLREDGYFQSFNPFYRSIEGKWKLDKTNWTFAQEITQINKIGSTSETRDALGRQTGTLYGFNKTMPEAVAVNASVVQIGVESFEDQDSACPGTEFKFAASSTAITQAVAHTGRNSIIVKPNSPVGMDVVLNSNCESSVKCNINLAIDSLLVSGSNPLKRKYSLLASGGMAPYNFDYSINFGSITDESISQRNTTFSFLTEINQPISIIVLVSDNLGCKSEILITRNGCNLSLSDEVRTKISGTSQPLKIDYRISPLNGVQPYFYSYQNVIGDWSDFQSMNNGSQYSFVHNGNAEGSVTISVQDATGCQAIKNYHYEGN